MERRTKHRILGVLVLIGLVIILLPFFQTSSDIPQDPTSLKAPPFPDQSAQVSTTTNGSEVNSPATDESTTTSMNAETQTPSTVDAPVVPLQSDNLSVNNATPVPNKEMGEVPDDTINLNQHPTLLNAKAPDITSSSPNAKATEEKKPIVKAATPEKKESIDDQVSKAISSAAEPTGGTADASATATDDEPVTTKPVKKVSTTKKSSKQKLHTATKLKAGQIQLYSSLIQSHDKVSSSDRDGLVKLKNATWVIQVGSFKNKATALKLVNKLRQKGYRSFIQQVNGEEEGTRVFVGPENKQASARTIANDLEAQLNVRGIVISYKPFAL